MQVMEPPSKQKEITISSLRDYLDALDRAGELHRITAEVDPMHELGAIAHVSLREKGPTLLFENIKGYDTPLVTNVLSTNSKVALAFGVKNERHTLFDAILAGMEHPIAPEEVASGPCKEVIQRGEAADVRKFPTPVWHELDAGQYFGTFHGCITKDPDSGDMNVGTYRLMIQDARTMSLSMFRDGRTHFRKWERMKEPMPMAIVVGLDPMLNVAAVNQISSAIAPHAEIAVAGGWRGRPVELTRCETIDMLVPAQAEIVVEGYVTPGKRVSDGPHGESHGFYGTDEDSFEFKVTCVTHRERPIHQGLICNFIEDGGLEITRSAVMWGQFKRIAVPGIVDVGFPDPGCGGRICVVAADITSKGQAHYIMEAVWALLPVNPAWTIVVDGDCDVNDWNDIWWRMYTMSLPHRDVWITPNRMIGGHYPQEKRDFVSRVGVDATSRFKDTEFPPVNAVSKTLENKVRARWAELGLASR